MNGELAALPAPLFDLELTLRSGQVFHWVRHGPGYLGAIGETPLYVEQQGEALLVPPGTEALARHYFSLDHPLEEIYASFPGDPGMQQALRACQGLRVIRQPLWECLATFITSSMKQVAHIARISHTLRRQFGQPLPWGAETLHSYPAPAALAGQPESALRACGLGYRAPNLLRSAAMIARGEVELEALRQLPVEEARQELLRLPGVGVKVANCVLLFAYEHLGAFPIDVWIERVLRALYFAGRRRVTSRRLQEFSASYFGRYGGYAQQYLFHHARAVAPRPPRPRSRKRARRPARPLSARAR